MVLSSLAMGLSPSTSVLLWYDFLTQADHTPVPPSFGKFLSLLLSCSDLLCEKAASFVFVFSLPSRALGWLIFHFRCYFECLGTPGSVFGFRRAAMSSDVFLVSLVFFFRRFAYWPPSLPVISHGKLGKMSF